MTDFSVPVTALIAQAKRVHNSEGQGMLIFNYPANDQWLCECSIANANKIVGREALAIPRNPNEDWPLIEQVDADLLADFKKILNQYFEDSLKRLCLGTFTTNSPPTRYREMANRVVRNLRSDDAADEPLIVEDK